jgi:hypothetical protein
MVGALCFFLAGCSSEQAEGPASAKAPDAKQNRKVENPLAHLTDEEVRALHGHLERNKTIFVELTKHGWRPEKPLTLDFAYNCPSKEAAESLRTYLKEETDYDLSVQGTRLEGSTQPQAVDQQTIQRWTFWMFNAGIDHGCEFDGWGTAVPD